MQISMNQVSFSYDGKKDIFQNIDFVIRTGEVVCILGPNGIGKTTLLHCLSGLLRPESGEIHIEGRPIRKMTPLELAKVIGYVPQQLKAAFDYTVLEYVVTGRAPWLKVFEKPDKGDYQKAARALEKLEISHLSQKPYTRLSGGELQQVSIARAITQEARFILMDEPTAHLDYGNQLKVLRMVKDLANQGYGIVMTTHNPDQALMLGGKVAIFNRDASFAFGDCGILTNETLTSLYQVPLKLMNVAGHDRRVCIPPDLK